MKFFPSQKGKERWICPNTSSLTSSSLNITSLISVRLNLLLGYTISMNLKPFPPLFSMHRLLPGMSLSHTKLPSSPCNSHWKIFMPLQTNTLTHNYLYCDPNVICFQDLRAICEKNQLFFY